MTEERSIDVGWYTFKSIALVVTLMGIAYQLGKNHRSQRSSYGAFRNRRRRK
jgi:hypothetical protein